MNAELENSYRNFLSNIYEYYDKLLKHSFSLSYWSDGDYQNERIPWKLVKANLKTLPEFQLTGVYIWGVEEFPLYVGKAVKQNFRQRFSRYVGGRKAQFSLAEEYSNSLHSGRKKEPKIIMAHYGISKSRALGVKAFGELGSAGTWCIIIPLAKEVVSGLETALISTARQWNAEKNLPPLINLDD